MDNTLAAKIAKDYKIDNIPNFVQRLNSLNKDIIEKGIVFYVPDNRNVMTGYPYHEVYDWDLYFENLYMSYYGVSDYCFSNVKSFLNQQCTNGFIPRTLVEKRERQHFKPFLAQVAELGSRQISDFRWLEERADRGEIQLGPVLKNISYYEQIKLSIEYWFRFCDFNHNGLPVWNSSDHSGMDNQISRAGRLDEFRFEGVDLACYIYREYSAMKVIADKLGKSNDSKEFDAKRKQLAAKINSIFWDEKDGFYYDRDEYTGKLVKVKSAVGFIPLWIGIVPAKRAKRIIEEHLKNPNEFWTKFPIACYAKTEPDYNQSAKDWGCNWRGTTWIPVNYMIMHGLIDYGYNDLAKELAQKTIDLVYKQNNKLREFYNGETGEGLGLENFWGWSSLGYMMPFEFEMNYSPDKLDGKPIRPIISELFNLKLPVSTTQIERISNKLSIPESRP